MFIKKRGLVILAVFCLAVMAACSNGATVQNKESSPSGEPQSAVGVQKGDDPDSLTKKLEDTKTELVITQVGATEDSFNQKYGNQLRKRFPNFTFKYIETSWNDFAQKIPTLPALDLMLISSSHFQSNVLDYHLEIDMGDLIKKYNYDVSRLEPKLIDAQKSLKNGKIFALPLTLGQEVLLYNKDLFDQFGVPYPKDGMTWDELYDLTHTMTRTVQGQQYQGLGMAANQIINYNQLSGRYFDPQTQEPQFTSDAIKQSFENTVRFLKIPGNENGSRDTFFKKQTTAMYIDGDGLIQMSADSLKNWGLARYPVYPDKPNVGPAPISNYGLVTAMAKHPDAAFVALEYLTSDEFQRWAAENTGTIPSVKDAIPLMTNYGKSIPNFQINNVNVLIFPERPDTQAVDPNFIIGDGAIKAAIKDYLAGKDVNTVLREANEKAKQDIAALQAK